MSRSCGALAVTLLAVSFVAGSAWAFGGPDDAPHQVITRGAGAATNLEQLRRARGFYLNSGAAYAQTNHYLEDYYFSKAGQAQAVISDLSQGKAVGADQIERALTTQIVVPNSDGGNRYMQQLREAHKANQMNSTSWTRTNPTLNMYFAGKAEEVEAVMDVLEAGQPIPLRDIQAALDTSEWQQY